MSDRDGLKPVDWVYLFYTRYTSDALHVTLICTCQSCDMKQPAVFCQMLNLLHRPARLLTHVNALAELIVAVGTMEFRVEEDVFALVETFQ